MAETWWRLRVTVAIFVFDIAVTMVIALPCDSSPCTSGSTCQNVDAVAYSCRGHCNQTAAREMWVAGDVSTNQILALVDPVTGTNVGPTIDFTSAGFSSATLAKWTACRPVNGIFRDARYVGVKFQDGSHQSIHASSLEYVVAVR
jgi:hypothetical protein